MLDKFQDKYRIPSARAAWWDYAANGAYFVTICTAHREHYFGEIVKTNTDISTDISTGVSTTPPQPLSLPPTALQQMQLSEIGKIVQQYWMEIPNHFSFVILDAFVVMPNHVHGIIIIDKPDDEKSGTISLTIPPTGKTINFIRMKHDHHRTCNISARPQKKTVSEPNLKRFFYLNLNPVILRIQRFAKIPTISERFQLE